MRNRDSVVVLEAETARELLKRFHEDVDFVNTSETDGADGMSVGVWYGIAEDDAIAASKAGKLKPHKAKEILRLIASPDAAMIDGDSFHHWHMELCKPTGKHGWRLVRVRDARVPWDVDRSADPWVCFDPNRPNKDAEAALTVAAFDNLAGDDDRNDFFGRFDTEILVALHKHLGRRMTARELKDAAKILSDAGDLFREAAKRVLQRTFREFRDRVQPDTAEMPDEHAVSCANVAQAQVEPVYHPE